LLLALTIFHMAWSLDARPYALAYLLAILATTAWLRLVRVGSMGAGFAYAAAAAGTIYVHWLSGLLVAAQAITGIGLLLWQRRGRSQLLRFVGFVGLVALLLLPAAPKLIHDLAHAPRHDWMRQYGADALAGSLAESLFDPLPTAALLFALIGHAVARIRGAGAVEARPDDRFALVALAALFLVPIAVATSVYLLFGVFFFVPRYLYFLSIALIPLAALLIDLLEPPKVRLGITLAAVVPCVLFVQVRSLSLIGSFKDYHADDRWREAFAELDRAYQPGDLLLFRACHIDEDYAAATGDTDAEEFIRNPLAGFYNRVAYEPVESLTKDWDPRLFSGRLEAVERAVAEAWRDDRRVIIAGADTIIRGRYYFDHLLEYLSQSGLPPFERVEKREWGKIRMLVLRPIGRPPGGKRAVSLRPEAGARWVP
jgi:hypothetical protein